MSSVNEFSIFVFLSSKDSIIVSLPTKILSLGLKVKSASGNSKSLSVVGNPILIHSLKPPSRMLTLSTPTDLSIHHMRADHCVPFLEYKMI